MTNTYKVPTLADLYADDETAYKNDKFKQLLNQPPPEQWIKTHKQTGIRYLPIDKVELLLDRIYVGRWKTSVLQTQLLVNAIQVTVRLEVFDPVNEAWTHHDGVGAMPIQLKQGATPGDLGAINHNSIQMNTPAAKSYAIKDAAEHLGKIFGRDITRKDTANYQPAFLSDPFNADQTGDTGKSEIVPPPPPPIPEHLEKHVAPEYTQEQLRVKWLETKPNEAARIPVIDNPELKAQPSFAANLFAEPGATIGYQPPANAQIEF